ncbi:YitT family protein [Anaerosphaera multitolerans]|uniref:YitT family protein n=1 Tax=Anaerosphaera multitolerans TaxID=2487351 RepID=A0A437S4L2_9FIRM|nr:YitT family protein [Anaerosphaera multitolerans]RVU53951.1 hypothetical protein EF514_09930 [Anaerosphaera multitolerans]
MQYRKMVEKIKKLFPPYRIFMILMGSAILSFGLYNVHQQSDVTEGGVLGLNLLINHWFGISMSYTAPVLDAVCYLLALKYLGKNFLIVSAVSTLSFSGFIKFWELFPPVFADLSNSPLLAAILGGIFVGVGAGLIVRSGGSSGGDDALALVIFQRFGGKVSWAYMFTDFSVLLLSLSYIPFSKIIFSLITVTVSSNVIELVVNVFRSEESEKLKDKKKSLKEVRHSNIV